MRSVLLLVGGTLLLLLVFLVESGVGHILCSQCNSLNSTSCLENPPPPENCTSCKNMTKTGCAQYNFFSYCWTLKEFDQNGTLMSITRSCGPLSMGDSCVPASRPDGQKVRLCLFTCKSDGCNSQNHISSDIRWTFLVLIIAIVMIVGT